MPSPLFSVETSAPPEDTPALPRVFDEGDGVVGPAVAGRIRRRYCHNLNEYVAVADAVFDVVTGHDNASTASARSQAFLASFWVW